MTTQIADSVVNDSAAPSSAFTPARDFLVIVDAGQVQLDIRINSVWYGLGYIDSNNSNSPQLRAGTATKVQLLEAGATYRIEPVGGKATASAYNLD